MDRRAYLASLKEAGLAPRQIRAKLRKEARRVAAMDLDALARWRIDDAFQAKDFARAIRAPFSKDENRILLGASVEQALIPVPSLDEVTDTREGDFVYTAQEKVASIENINAKRARRFLARKVADVGRNSMTLILSCITLLILIGIVIYTFSTGWHTFSWDFITGDYHQETSAIHMDAAEAADPDAEFSYDPGENEFFSTRWGIAFLDTTKTDGSYDLQISYIAPDSPLKRVKNLENQYVQVLEGTSVSTLIGYDDEGSLVVVSSSNGAEGAANLFDRISYIFSGFLQTGGFGIRGPLIATLWMILLALIIALPLGIGGAIYLSIYAKPGRLTRTIKSMIDMISGIPSIIFGLAGAIIFIPIFNWTGSTGNLMSGAATLACMVLPTILKSTEEAIHAIPRSLSSASLALGASQTQTVFKVILPNSVPGILTGTLLAIGRIIGESAALVFATGSTILDNPTPTSGGATLAVYIWRVMQGENPNYAAASAAAMLILIVVLALNIIVKIIAVKFDRFRPQKTSTWVTRAAAAVKSRLHLAKGEAQTPEVQG